MMTRNRNLLILLAVLVLLAGGFWAYQIWTQPQPLNEQFNGDRAFQDVRRQVELGPRIPGTDGHAQVITMISDEIEQFGWQVDLQQVNSDNLDVQNIVAHRGGKGPLVILGAHYDTRQFADRDKDPAKRSQPVPGADDGASGVAVLLELARILPRDIPVNVELVFFDAEDQGDIQGQKWIIGSTVFANSLTEAPRAVVVLDMIGDANLNIYKERSSNQSINDSIWSVAKSMGYDKYFIPTLNYNMLDDHTPFLQKGYPAVDLIDFDYPAWHTTEDTPDKVTPQSLKIVGDTIYKWIIDQPAQ